MTHVYRFRTEQGHCGACRRKWQLTDTDLCPCGKTQTMSHIVESCPLTKLNGSLSRLQSADEDAVSWLTNYGKWHAYEKKKKIDKITILCNDANKTSVELLALNILSENLKIKKLPKNIHNRNIHNILKSAGAVWITPRLWTPYALFVYVSNTLPWNAY